MKIVELYEIQLSKQEIEELGPELTAALSTLAYAANEINCFMGLYLASEPEMPRYEVIKKKARIQKFILTRAMNAKIFEALKAIGDIRKIIDRYQEKTGRKDFSEMFTVLDSLTSELGYTISKELRNNVTSHYLPSKVRDNLSRVAGGSARTLFFHRSSGDSFYPFAEDYVFGAQLNQLAKEHNMDLNSVVDEWMEWSVKASQEISSVFEGVLKHVIMDKLHEKHARETKPYVEVEYVAGFRTRPLPLFHTEDFRKHLEDVGLLDADDDSN